MACPFVWIKKKKSNSNRNSDTWIKLRDEKVRISIVKMYSNLADLWTAYFYALTQASKREHQRVICILLKWSCSLALIVRPQNICDKMFRFTKTVCVCVRIVVVFFIFSFLYTLTDKRTFTVSSIRMSALTMIFSLLQCYQCDDNEPIARYNIIKFHITLSHTHTHIYFTLLRIH